MSENPSHQGTPERYGQLEPAEGTHPFLLDVIQLYQQNLMPYSEAERIKDTGFEIRQQTEQPVKAALADGTRKLWPKKSRRKTTRVSSDTTALMDS